MNTSPVSKERLAMEVQMYSEKEGQERIEHHEKWLAQATLGFVMYSDGGDKVDFMFDYMRDDTDGRYNQVHYLVWHFKNINGAKTIAGASIEDEEKEAVFSDLIRFAIWAIEGDVWAMDKHFTDSVTELLKIPQLSTYHKDIRTVWNNYVELATRLGFTICEDHGFLAGTGNDNDKQYEEERKKLFGEDPSGYDCSSYYANKVEEFLRKDTSYPSPSIDE